MLMVLIYICRTVPNMYRWIFRNNSGGGVGVPREQRRLMTYIYGR